jgi:hypothetical protein
MAAASQTYIAAGGHGCGAADGTHKRAVRLARMWLNLKAKPARVKELAALMDCHWRTVYIDIMDMTIEPLEEGYVLDMIGAGLFAVRDLRQKT